MKRAPGEFIGILRRKAENAGVQVTELSARSTKLTCACHCNRPAVLAWPGANLLLERSVSRVRDEAAKCRIYPDSFGVNRRQSCLPVKDGSTIVDAGKVIPVYRETADIAVRTPWF